MVAETSNLPPAKPRKKPQFGPGNPIPLAVRLAVRSMYVIQGLQPSQIAPLVHLTGQQVAALVRNEGWSKLRAQKRIQKEASAVARQDARASEEVSRIQEAAAIRTEECMVKTADHCAAVLNAETIDGKELQMASGSLRNFVQSVRMLRGMDSRQGPANVQGEGNTTNLIFVGALERAAPKAERNVTEVSATPVPPSAPTSPALT